MSFFGKQYKKVKSENAMEVIGKLNLSESTIALLRTPDSVSTFTKNADGTIQYVIKNGSGTVILDQKITLSSLYDYKSPDGMDTKVKFELNGDVLKSEMHLPSGKVVNMDRYFDANGMKMELFIKDSAEKAIVHYEVV